MIENEASCSAKIYDTQYSIEIGRKMTKTVAFTETDTERLNIFEASSFRAISKPYE